MKKKTMELFESLTEDQREDIIDFMDMPKFVRVSKMFMDKFWWLPWALSFIALTVSILTKKQVL